MEITIKIQHNDDMRSITLISPNGDTLILFSEEVIDFFHGVEQSHKLTFLQKSLGVTTTPDMFSVQCSNNPAKL